VLSSLSMTTNCACGVGACPVGCSRPVFGPVVPYFLACGGGRVSHWSAIVAV